MARDFVADNSADHRAHRRVAGVAVTDFMPHHATDHTAQYDRCGGRTIMARMIMSRSVITRRGCMTIIMLPVMPVAVTEMSRQVPPVMAPPVMPARMGIMPLEVCLAVNRTVITSTVPRLSKRCSHHGGQEYHGSA